MKGSRHPAPAVLVAFVHGTLDREERQEVVRHLVAGCARCGERIVPVTRAMLAAGPESLPRPRGPFEEYDVPLRRALKTARRHETARRRAAQEVAILLRTDQLPTDLPAPEVRRTYAAAWLEAARELRRERPECHEQGAHYSASLAEGLLVIGEAETRGGERRQDADRAAAAWGEVGNARRRRGDLPAAEKAFRTAMSHAGRGSGDPLLDAALFDLSASLRIDERQFDRAEESLALAGLLYEKAGEETKVAKTLVQRGMVAAYAQNFEAAVSLFSRALDRIDRTREPELFRTAVMNAIRALVDLGDFPHAEALFADAQPLLEEIGGPVDQLKIRWLEAKIQRGAGRCHQAEWTLLEIRRAFVGLGMPYYVALTTLELCPIWLREGRHRELRAAVAEALAAFLALGIEREALAAVILLDQAAQQERATVELVTRALREAEAFETAKVAGAPRG